jgi:hypothetical protein
LTEYDGGDYGAPVMKFTGLAACFREEGEGNWREGGGV